MQPTPMLVRKPKFQGPEPVCGTNLRPTPSPGRPLRSDIPSDLALDFGPLPSLPGDPAIDPLQNFQELSHPALPNAIGDSTNSEPQAKSTYRSPSLSLSLSAPAGRCNAWAVASRLRRSSSRPRPRRGRHRWASGAWGVSTLGALYTRSNTRIRKTSPKSGGATVRPDSASQSMDLYENRCHLRFDAGKPDSLVASRPAPYDRPNASVERPNTAKSNYSYTGYSDYSHY